MTSTQSPSKKCDLCGRAIRRGHNCLAGTFGYRHQKCEDRRFEGEGRL